MKHKILFGCILVMFYLVGSSASGQVKTTITESGPNFIAIVTNEYSLNAVGCYWSEFLGTQKIDKEEKEGIIYQLVYSVGTSLVFERNNSSCVLLDKFIISFTKFGTWYYEIIM